MGSFDSAETSDMIGLFILYKLTTNFLDIGQVYLYRDDGLYTIATNRIAIELGKDYTKYSKT